MRIADKVITLTASFGVAAIDGDHPVKNADPFIKLADLALYQAKNAGRNRVETSIDVACAVPAD